MNRRDFMKGILAAGIAPAIVKAENLMRINPQLVDQARDLSHLKYARSGEGVMFLCNTFDRPIGRCSLQMHSIMVDPCTGRPQAWAASMKADMVAARSGVASHVVIQTPCGDIKRIPVGPMDHLRKERVALFAGDRGMYEHPKEGARIPMQPRLFFTRDD